MEEATKKFEAEITKLIKLAKESGISDCDIDECIVEVLKDPIFTRTVPAWELALKFAWKSVQFMFKAAIIFIAFMVLLSTLSYFAPARVTSVIEKPFIPHYYKLQRFLRLAALPLHNYFNFSSYYHSQCFIDNPFYDPKVLENETECAACTKISSPIQQIDNLTTKADNAFVFEDIVVYLGYSKRVSLKKLRSFYDNHTDTLDINHDGKPCGSLADIIPLDVPSVEQMNIRWQTANVDALNPLVKMPIVMPTEFTRKPNVTLYAFGPKSSHIDLHDETSDDILRLLTQLYGSSDVMITPQLDNCIVTCGQHRIILHAGHSIQYSAKVWGVSIVANTTDITSVMSVFEHVIPPEYRLDEGFTPESQSDPTTEQAGQTTEQVNQNMEQAGQTTEQVAQTTEQDHSDL